MARSDKNSLAIGETPWNERQMRPAVIAWLRATGHPFHCFESYFSHGLADVVGYRFAEQIGRRIPPLEAVAVVELKLSKIAEVIGQASRNRYYVAQSWAAMPEAFVQQMRPQSFGKFQDAGVGLLAVDGPNAREVFKPLGQLREGYEPGEFSAYIAKNLPRKLWRRRFEEEAADMAALDAIVDRAVAELDA